ncbi:MAG: O-antigen ligase family protein [Bryobacteraceae bacterium]
MRPIRVRVAAPIFDKYLITPILASAYSLVIDPMWNFFFPVNGIMASRVENKIFWPLVTAIALGCLAFRNRSRFTWPPHIVWFAAYLALAGASVLWAFKPGISFSRFTAEIMMLIAIMPLMFADRKADIMPSLFYCFAVGAILNAVVILSGNSIQSESMGIKIGYPGVFSFKGELGEFAAFAILFGLYQSASRGGRRASGLIIVGVSIYLVLVSGSKGALGCALLAAMLAILVLFAGKKMRVSPLIVLLPLLIGYAGLSKVLGNLINRISWYTYGNYDLSGRIYIWDLVNLEIAKRPLLGWGYRSIWLVGPDSPTLVDSAGSWVGKMPTAHNGYLDMMMDSGYIGIVLFVIFILTTLHAIGRVMDRDPTRAWLLLSIALFISLQNFLETSWLQGAEPLWLMFVIVAAEAARYWQPVPPDSATVRPVFRRGSVAAGPTFPARARSVARLPRSPGVNG